MRKKVRNEILDYFKNITDEQARRDPYYKGEINMFKHHSYKELRIFYGYCKECYGKHYTSINCSICNGNILDRIVLFAIYQRPKLYQKLTPE